MLVRSRMPALQVKKVVAVGFLEATKLALEHIGAYRLELSQQRARGPAELPALYGDVRRLRDYLQRCVSGYRELVPLELSPADASLLVACFRRAIDAISSRLVERAVTRDESSWLEGKRALLAEWALQLAAKPLIELPLRAVSTQVLPFSRTLSTKLADKVYGSPQTRAKFGSPSVSMSGPATHGKPPSFAEQLLTLEVKDEPEATTVAAESRAAAEPAPYDFTTQSSPGTTLLDSRQLRDGRLRALVRMEQASWVRADAACDYRLATVLMAVILECAIVDHGLAFKTELGLTGLPEDWDLQAILLRGMGSRAEAQDTGLAYHLFASRNLLRPALQIAAPVVVTAASYARLLEFVRRALRALGFGAEGAVEPTAEAAAPPTESSCAALVLSELSPSDPGGVDATEGPMPVPE
jgi:hypothetical protein